MRLWSYARPSAQISITIGAQRAAVMALSNFPALADVQQFDMNATEEKTAFQLINHDEADAAS